MSEKSRSQTGDSESFIKRWSQRKHQQQARTMAESPPSEINPEQPVAEPVREEDLPPVESLQEDSEVSMFLGEGISEKLRRQALRRLFHFDKFNVCDGLDDYAEDYTVFEPLSDLFDIQQQLKHATKTAKISASQPADSQTTSTPETGQAGDNPDQSNAENNDETTNE